MKKDYSVTITAIKDFQPTQKDLIEAIRSAIDKKIRATPANRIPHSGSTKIEIFSRK